MISPQPPLEAGKSPDYGGQLDREGLKTATLSGARWAGESRIVAEVVWLATTVLLRGGAGLRALLTREAALSLEPT